MTTASFPPIDDLISKLYEIDYQKHLRNFINAAIVFAAIVAAVATVLVQRISQWYKKGGKDYIQETYTKIKNFFDICYIWIRCEGYPELVKFCDDLQQTYRAWRDLVTV